MEASAPSLLIADTDHEFIDDLLRDPLAQKHPPYIVKNELEWVRFTEKNKPSLDGIFFNPNSFMKNGLSILILAHKKFLGVPMYALEDTSPSPWAPQELELLGFAGLVKKPLSYSELMKRCINTKFRSEKLNPVNKFTLEDEHPEFSRIYARFFMRGKSSAFDLYAQTEKNHFVKILSQGDVLEEERIKNYLNHGVSHFYVKKNKHENFIKYVYQLSSCILNEKRVPVSLQIQQTLSLGDQVRSFMRSQSVNENEIGYCEDVLKDVVKLTTELDLKQHLNLSRLSEQVLMHEHSVSCAFIALLLARSLGFQSKKILVNLGVSALLHDLGLKTQDEPTYTRNSSWIHKQSPEFFRHPIDGALQLEKLGKRLDPTIAVSVLQHHERRDGKGFPFQLGAGKISLFSEIIGVSDMLVHLLVDKSGMETTSYELTSLHHHMNQELKTGFSGTIAKVVENKLLT